MERTIILNPNLWRDVELTIYQNFVFLSLLTQGVIGIRRVQSTQDGCNLDTKCQQLIVKTHNSANGIIAFVGVNPIPIERVDLPWVNGDSYCRNQYDLYCLDLKDLLEAWQWLDRSHLLLQKWQYKMTEAWMWNSHPELVFWIERDDFQSIIE